MNASIKYKMIAKFYDETLGMHLFTLENEMGGRVRKTAREIWLDKNYLNGLGYLDIYNIGFTRGVESVLEEGEAIRQAQ